jgi:hypothetical protein
MGPERRPQPAGRQGPGFQRQEETRPLASRLAPDPRRVRNLMLAGRLCASQRGIQNMWEPEFDMNTLRKCMIACPIAAAIITTIVYWPGWWN